jgi:acyl-CoA synthetase (AMP-forming)/AMP-acid ligase II
MVLDAGVPRAALASARALRFGSAPLEEEALDRFEALYGIPVLAQYGATEFAGTITAMTLADRRRFGAAKRRSVGRARPGIGLRVVTASTGDVLPPDAIGQLQVLVPRVSPEWLPTNDLARLDADGFLFIEGRADDAINRGGFKVLPEEVAAVLRRHPAIADAVVVGLPDARLGAVPAAAVELRAGVDPPSESVLLAFARDHLVAYQVPSRIVAVAALPRTVSLKVDRPAARRLLEAAATDGG